ncbi:MAG: Re/Si-specific NAD(P)(+) transhydrogenase subunit alpha [Verrucomicrobia bacterium]|nr:Re/Si-specific NAD(P)(+) transhydrogenase subunit alpha [Verrucomicrobiota bacterium]
MHVFVPKELFPGETRVPILPGAAAKLIAKGAQVTIESGLGVTLGIPDQSYLEQGAQVSSDRHDQLRRADLVFRLRKPPSADLESLRRGGIQVGLLDPFNERELVERLAAAGVTAISLEMVPRITVAQKMDALSSQANLAGYVAVVLAANTMNRIFPLMMTAAGTIKPIRLLVIGVGVAGLQAIATARRLGATVEAFDTRPVVEEQVKSLGARFIKLDLGETGQTAGGYAKELAPAQLQKQQELLAAQVAEVDVVITAAQVFGKRAPIVVTTEMVRRMRPGSVVVDTAVDTGGNVECSERDTIADVGGVKVVGLTNLPGRVAANASEMFSTNLGAFFDHLWDAKNGVVRMDLQDEILRGCVITHAGTVCHEMIQRVYAEHEAVASQPDLSAKTLVSK